MQQLDERLRSRYYVQMAAAACAAALVVGACGNDGTAASSTSLENQDTTTTAPSTTGPIPTEPLPTQTVPTASSTTAPTETTASTNPTTTTTTLPVVRLAVAGDTGTGREGQHDVAALMASGEASSEYDALLLLGDMIYERGNPSLIDERIWQPYEDTLDDGTQLVPMIGNHDVRMGREEQIMTELGAPGRWYSVDLASALIVVLDTTIPKDADQLAWLEAELSNAEQRWIIAAMHHPPYSAGHHGSHLATRRAFEDMFIEHGVDLVMAGHDHDYQRSHPISGITYVVTGGGAKQRPTGAADFTVVSDSVLHYLDLEISWDTIDGVAFGVDGVVDEFTIDHAASNKR